VADDAPLERPAKAWATIEKAVDGLERLAPDTDPTVVDYLTMRAAALRVRARHGAGNAAQLLYRLADEFAGEGTQ